ncbi:MAG: helix-turn-helix domain-containing protein [Candidatus Howiella sp.]|jgi:predicted transcriptional regulator
MYQRWPKRDPIKNCFLMPNEIFCLGLDYKEISIYAYLLRCEDRKTYQCHPSYRTIGKAVKMCENTVRKYVLSLEEKGLIYTEPTMITTKDGRARNGSLRYTIRPIQGAVDSYYQRQMVQAEEAAIIARAEKRLAELNTEKEEASA